MKTIFLVASLLFLQACGAKKLAVEHADTFIESSVTKRLPLNSAQQEVLSKDIDTFLMKKKNVAQDLLPIIDQIKVEEPDKIDGQYDKFLTHYRDLAGDFSQIMAKHLASLDSNQQTKFFSRMDEENKDVLESNDTERVEQVKRKVEKLIGPLKEQQEKFFSDHKTYFEDKAKSRVDRKVSLNGKLKEILAMTTPPASKETQVRAAFDLYQKESIESSRSNLPLIKKFLPSMTTKQKEIFRERIQDAKEMIGYYIEADY